MPQPGGDWVSSRGPRTEPITVLGGDSSGVGATARHTAGRLLAAMPVGFIFWDRDWRCIGVNAQGEALCGLSAAELMGRSLWDLFPETVGTEFETVYRRAAATGRPGRVEIFYPEPLNRWLDIHDAPDRDRIAAY